MAASDPLGPVAHVRDAAAAPHTQQGHMAFVDGLRGLAALAVVAYHLGLRGPRAPRLGQAMPAAGLWLVDRGGLGVAVFFVLSGFVMAHALRDGAMDRRRFAAFAVRRVLRLTPPYYAAIGLALLVAGLATVIKGQEYVLEDTPLSAGRLIAQLLYVQPFLGYAGVSSVFWTLCYEMAFYLSFAGLLWAAAAASRLTVLRGRGRAVVFAVVGVAALVPALSHLQDDLLPFPWLSGLFVFLLGTFTYWVCRGALPFRWWLLYLISVLAAGVLVEPAVKVVSCATAVLLLLAWKRRRMSTWLRSRPVQYLGRISYSLYLTHSLALTVVYFLVQRVVGTGALGQRVYVLAGVVAALLAADLVWRAVERPSIATSRRVGRRSPSTTPPIAS